MSNNNGLELYGDFSIEAAQDDAELLKKKQGNFIRTLEEGSHKFRFLPPRAGETSPFKIVWEHYVDLASGGTGFVCPREMAKQPCPTCRESARLLLSDKPADQERGKRLQPRQYTYALVIDRNDEAAGAKVLRIGRSVHQDLLNFRNELKLNFTHPQTGIDIIITRKGKGLNDTEYKTITDPEGRSPLCETNEELIDLFESLPDLNSYARVPPIEEIEARLRGEKFTPQQIGVRDAGKPSQLPAGKTAASYMKK